MADLLGIQILGLLFGFFMMYYSFLHYKRKEFTIKEYSFWFLFWAAFIIITLFPRILNPVLIKLNISRTLDFFIVTGFLFMIFVVVYTYIIVRKNQKKLEDVVRKMALKKK
ncbi:MAG: DUF2304 domain-containing protein [Candidatus Woesearchaeota archaeon]|jgi:hypothetical protein|nr:hypothetical protein [archaeon]MDP6548335.1 DUF2304 domain-containing protein [Candidatus Woesearchaeota archaeon]MDP7263824.1 DUF2304 domain-containing protein [Candidatus Woesearchaeota archaeon]MDP7622881.1 DUF2304 domain-containing protein [Candidatus Woesearchaeota archaeon]HJN56859.1 DUF2304 domain-containing protein [Candidatus Woesearchaeota archaeon]|tara:strand:+ start:134 stop:466 length:333 start_codon:yes stop_codon:yes gene_type:complete